MIRKGKKGFNASTTIDGNYTNAQLNILPLYQEVIAAINSRYAINYIAYLSTLKIELQAKEKIGQLYYAKRLTMKMFNVFKSENDTQEQKSFRQFKN